MQVPCLLSVEEQRAELKRKVELARKTMGKREQKRKEEDEKRKATEAKKDRKSEKKGKKCKQGSNNVPIHIGLSWEGCHLKTEESAQGCQVKKVRDRVLCTDCGKWRCVYSTLGSAAFDEIRDSFERAVEDTMWSCGEPFENKEYRTNLKKTCSDAMESNYYSREHWRHFPVVCCWCGSESNMAKEKRKAMLEEGYETVLPMCTLCDAINLAWQTRGKISQDRVSREKRAVAEAQAGSGPEVKRRKAPAKTVGQGEGNEAEKESL
jgi:hypothetical protein